MSFISSSIAWATAFLLLLQFLQYLASGFKMFGEASIASESELAVWAWNANDLSVRITELLVSQTNLCCAESLLTIATFVWQIARNTILLLCMSLHVFVEVVLGFCLVIALAARKCRSRIALARDTMGALRLQLNYFATELAVSVPPRTMDVIKRLQHRLEGSLQPNRLCLFSELFQF